MTKKVNFQKSCALLFALCIAFLSSAQCNFISLDSQTDVDQFSTNYGSCSSIGSLEIYSSPTLPDPILNLDALVISGSIENLLIYADASIPLSLSGFSGITSLSNLEIYQMADFSGLENLQTVGSLRVLFDGDDPGFNLSGFSGLQSAQSIDLGINCPSAHIHNAFPSLTTVSDIYISSSYSGNPMFMTVPTTLVSLDGFHGITEINAFAIGDEAATTYNSIDSLSIMHNLQSSGLFVIDMLATQDFNSFGQLSSTAFTDFLFYSDDIIQFPSLTNTGMIQVWMAGFTNGGLSLPVLSETGYFLLLMDLTNSSQTLSMPELRVVNSSMDISNNSPTGSELNLNFGSLDSIYGDLSILATMFNDLSQFSTLTYVGGSITITDNSSISNCDIEILCEKIATQPGMVTIENNGGSCTIPDIINNCLDMYITGTVYADLNCNGSFDPEDEPISYPLILNEANAPVGFSTANGQYFLIAEPNSTYTLQAAPVNGLQASPLINVVTTSGTALYPDQNIGLCPIPEYFDLSLSLYSGILRPGFGSTYAVSVQNNSPNATIANLLIDLSLLSDMAFIDSSIPFSTSGTGVFFEAFEIAPYGSEVVYLQILLGANVPLGTLNLVTVSVNTDGSDDANPDNNVFETAQTVVGSYDPNDISVDLTAIDFENMDPSGEWLTYQIRFQNTGNFPAEFIRVVNVQDENLVLSSIEVLATSHPAEMSFDGQEISWFFDNIQLPDSASDPEGSQGFILFRIRIADGVSLDDLIPSTAAIYFDYNEPVITNTVTTLFYVCPASPLISGNNTVCAGDDVTVLVTDAYENYTWSVNGTVIGNTTSVIWTADASATIELEASSTYCNAHASFEVNVLPLPDYPVIGGPLDVCEGENASYLTTGEYAAYAWTFGDETIGSESALSFSPSSSGLLILTVSNDDCTSSSSVSINLLALPETPLITQNENTLTASGSGYFIWTFNGEEINDHDNSIEITASGTYSVSVSENACASEPASGNFTYTGLNELSQQILSVYPNPGSGPFFLRLPEGESFHIRILNSTGQVVVDNSLPYSGTCGIEVPEASGIFTLEFTSLQSGKKHFARLIKTS